MGLFSSSNKLHGIAAIYGREGSGKTNFLKTQLKLPFFADYDIIVIGKKKEWKDFPAEEIIDHDELDTKRIKKLLKYRDKIIVIDDADELEEKFGGERKFYSYVKKLSKKNQIIFSAKNLPDYPMEYEIIVRLTGVGSKIIVLRHGVRSEYSWESMQDDAIFMVAVLE